MEDTEVKLRQFIGEFIYNRNKVPIQIQDVEKYKEHSDYNKNLSEIQEKIQQLLPEPYKDLIAEYYDTMKLIEGIENDCYYERGFGDILVILLDSYIQHNIDLKELKQ